MLRHLGGRGLSVEDIAFSAVQAGAAGYTSSYITPYPLEALWLRASTIPDIVTGRIPYSPQQDQYIGRVLSGLPVHSHDFALLPPHFPAQHRARAEYAVRTLFPTAPPDLEPVLLMCLASLVFHQQHLRDHLPATHPIFTSGLFTTSLHQDLLPMVVSGHARSDGEIRATGVPSHISTLVMLHELRTGLQLVIPALEASIPRIVSRVYELLEQKASASAAPAAAPAASPATSSSSAAPAGAAAATSSGSHTRAGAGTLDGNGVSSAAGPLPQHSMTNTATGVLLLQTPAPSQSSSSSSSSSSSMVTGGPASGSAATSRAEPVTYQRHLWQGSYHAVPESFQIPVAGLHSGWSQWMLGDSTMGYPPLRGLKPTDLPTPQMRRRWTDFKRVMLELETKVPICYPTELYGALRTFSLFVIIWTG